jgi:protein SCO1
LDSWKRSLGKWLMVLAVAPTATLTMHSRAWSHDQAHHGQAAGPGGHSAPVISRPVRPVDSYLFDQDGRKVRLASDVLADKVVVVTFVYTNCADTCPIVSHTFSQLQEKLGGLMDKRVRLVSLTVDPARDTPARLKAYSARFDAKPGWLWLTGEPSNVAAALQGFGVHITRPETHPAQVLVGDLRSGRWVRLYDVDKPQQVLAEVVELLAAQGPEKTAVEGSTRNEPCTPHVRAGAANGCTAQSVSPSARGRRS